ncbi:MAG: multicopper oxidase domain-containing protein [Gemmatimonadota bacterium]
MYAHRLMFLAALGAAALPLGSAERSARPVHTERIAPNDNEHRAGLLAHGVLTVALEARNGEWHPEESSGPTISVQAFSVAGGPLQTPGPLLRAPVGTELRVTVHNALAVPMWVYGLGEHRGFADSTEISAGETREMHFRATTPGLSYYAGRTSAGPVGVRTTEDSQLNGAIVIDPPGTTPSDRIFVISQWHTRDSTTASGLGAGATLAFNGLEWPHTPRIDLVQGDTARWRIVNVTVLPHPLHLHGAYFRIDAKGDGRADSIYAPEDRRMAVTELMLPGQTMSMSWAPVHSGNWVFHCHIASHASSRDYFNAGHHMPSQMVAAAVAQDKDHLSHMGGLVIGIRVKPRGIQETAQPISQSIRLLVRSRANVYGEDVGYGYVRGDSPDAAMRDSFSVPGPTLELKRGKRVAITIVNQSHEAAAVHWHGIELESLPDGVPGLSGSGTTTIPFIMPGDSFTVRFTAPRAGTFMYHSHSNEMQQVSSGLYGAIIVRDDTAAARDEHTLLFSDDGPFTNFFEIGPPTLLNGKLHPDTIDVRAGQATRLRLINIRAENSIDMTLERDGAPVLWRMIAKDGAALPAHQIRERPATLSTNPGETYDFEITAEKPGVMFLKYDAMPGDSTNTPHAVIRVH